MLEVPNIINISMCCQVPSHIHCFNNKMSSTNAMIATNSTNSTSITFVIGDEEPQPQQITNICYLGPKHEQNEIIQKYFGDRTEVTIPIIEITLNDYIRNDCFNLSDEGVKSLAITAETLLNDTIFLYVNTSPPYLYKVYQSSL